MSRRGRQIASVSILAALLVGYGMNLFLFDDDGAQHRRASESGTHRARSLQAREAADLDEDRVLALNGDSPAALDEVPGEFVVKPWVGYAATNVWETYPETRLILASAQSSTVEGADFIPKYAIEPHPNQWASSTAKPEPIEWLQIDTGGPQSLQEIYIRWGDAYAVDYTIQVGPERVNCRSNGESCPDYWINVAQVTGKSNSDATMDTFAEGQSPQGVRYIRIVMNQRAAGKQNFSIYQVKVYRNKMIIGESPTGTYCGATTPALASTLLSRHGGTLIHTYEDAEFFVAQMTEAQKDAMFADPCTFTVEPNYIVRARGRTMKKRLGRHSQPDNQEHRSLAIPEFNLRDETPANWGLERISSHGKRNGKYTWFHEGAGVDIYMFDTGIYPDHSDWSNHNGTSRLQDLFVCTGTSNDYESNAHGTHMASIAGGFTFGTAKSSAIHPIQVLDENGEGTTSSFLCGVDKVIADAKAFNAANAPKKYRAVVNLSLGVNGRSDALDKAVKDMTMLGIIVVIAAGDNHGNACFYSPYDASAITVGALKDHAAGLNDKTATSNYGQCIDVWAPGEDINGASNLGEYESVSMSGTSVAAAFTSGAAALFAETTMTKEVPIEELSATVKEKLINKAENFILDDIGHGSPSKVLQTTVSKCTLNSHCEAGLTCLFDGTCRDMSKPLKKKN